MACGISIAKSFTEVDGRVLQPPKVIPVSPILIFRYPLRLWNCDGINLMCSFFVLFFCAA